MQRDAAPARLPTPVFAWQGAALLAAAAALAATLTGWVDLRRSGVFDWHLQQPTFLRAVTEFSAVAVLLWFVLRLRDDRVRIGASALLVLAYLRFHEVDLAAVASGLYCLGIYGLGVVVDRRLLGAAATDASIGRHAAIGLASLSLVLWSAALSYGLDFSANRRVALLLAALGLVGWALTRPWRSFVVPARSGALASAATALAMTCLLAILVRSNSVLYYDSIWYGARPDRVLFGSHGVYSFLGLTTQVHYYPKMYEVALAPLQGLGDLSIDIGFNIWGLLFLMYAAWRLAVTCGMDERRARVLAVAMACFPAFAGVAETTKGDVLAAAFVLLAAEAYQRNVADRDPRRLAEVLVYALLASALRLSSLPWLLSLAVLAALALARTIATPGGLRPLARWGVLAFVMLGVASVGLVHYRTLRLTGTPLITNASTQALFDRMGFPLRYPIGALTGGEPAAGLRGLADVPGIALRPTGYVFHIFKWTGGIWIAGAIVATIALAWLRRGRGWRRANVATLVMGLSLPLLLCLNSWPVAGGDGNYFLVPTLCLAIAGFAAVPASRLGDGLLLLCGAAGLGAYLLTSNWVPGIKPEPVAFSRSPLDANAQIGAYLESADLTYVANYFGSCQRLTRVTGLLPETGQAFALPVRYEPLGEMAWNNEPAFRSADDLYRLLRATGTQFVVLPTTDTLPHMKSRGPLFAFVGQSLQQYIAAGAAREVARRGNYAIYRLTQSAPTRGCPDR